MKVAGHWEGKLLDVSGVQALVDLTLDGAGREITGTFRATLLPAREDVCGGSTRGQTVEGPVRGTVEDDGALAIRAELDAGGQKVVARFAARPGNPDPHARAAFFGGYDVDEGASALTLQGGACVLWRYANAQRREVG